MTISSAVILAAGSGERFWPYATVRNKCASPIANVPNIRRLVDSLVEIGVHRIAVAVGVKEGSIRSALAGSSADIVYVSAVAELGTSGAALTCARVLTDDRFLVIYGDTVTSTENLRRFVDGHAASGLPGAVMWDPMPLREGSLWYGVEAADGQVQRIVGHDSDAAKRMCGVFIADRTLLPVLESNPGLMRSVPIGGMPPAEPDFAQSINDWKVPVLALEATDFVVDLDKPWHLLQANRLMVEHLCGPRLVAQIDPSARIHDGAEITGPIRVGAGAEIGNRVVLAGPAIVGEGTRIVNGAILRGKNVIGDGSRISDYCLLDSASVVGNDCVLGHGAEMDGVMLDGSFLWHYCEIAGIVGLSVDIGAATVCGTLRFDDGLAEHNVRGRKERPAEGGNATYFGDYSRTGVNVVTMPGAKIGAYSCIGASVIVYGDIPERTLRILKQETVDRAWGPERYGW